MHHMYVVEVLVSGSSLLLRGACSCPSFSNGGKFRDVPVRVSLQVSDGEWSVPVMAVSVKLRGLH